MRTTTAIALVVAAFLSLRSMAQPACPTMTTENILISWSGSKSGCNAFDPSTDCAFDDLISFNAVEFGYDFSCGAHDFLWDFGDATPLAQGRTPSHTFPSVTGLESYRIRLTIRNGSGMLILVKTINVHGGTPTTTSLPRIKAFFADVPRTMLGQPVTLSWSVGNTHTIEIDPIDFEASGESAGSHSFVPVATNIYTLTAYGTAGAAGRTLRVEVIDTPCTAPPPEVSIAWLGQTSGCSPTNQKPCAIGETIAFSILPFDDFVPTCFHSFRWTFGDRAVSTSQNPTHVYSGPGSMFVRLNVTTALGTVVTAATLQVGTPSLGPIAYFIAKPASVVRGQPVTLRWSARDVSELLISPLNLRTNDLNGSIVVYPSATTTYSLTAVDTATVQGSTTATVVLDSSSRRRVVRH